MTVKRLIRISYFAMLAVIGSMIRFPVQPVPFTMQAFFAVIAGFVLGGSDGAYSQLAFVLLGIIGLPVFAGGGGYTYVLEPTFGYLAALIIGAYGSGFLLRRRKTIKVFTVFVSGLAGLASVYIIGAAYQIIIYISSFGYGVSESLYTLRFVPLFFLIHAAMLLLVSLFYPKLTTMVGKINKEKFKDNGLPSTAAPSESGAQIAAAKDKPSSMVSRPPSNTK